MKEMISKCTEYCKNLRILYVEDNEEARTFTVEMLKRFFQHISTAKDGEEGLQKFKNNEFDIILTDITMPKMNGLEMAREMKSLNNSIPILILSAHNDEQFFLSSIEIGIDGYILKHLEIKQFLETLLKTVEKIHLQTKLKEYQRKLETNNTELEIKVKERTKELEYRLYNDTLTGLSNYEAILRDINSEKKESICLVDINGFQKLNNSYGLDAGDKILKAFAKKLIEFNKDNLYSIYRAYGDEFVISNKNIINEESFKEQKSKLLNYFANIKIYLDTIEEDIDIEVTLGVAINEVNPFVKARMALQYAKKENISSAVYTKELDSSKKLLNDLYWKREIKLALNNDEIIPVFQAIVDKSENIIKYESLIRLRQYEGNEEKLITPHFFLDSAVKTGYYYRLTKVMVEKSFIFMENKTVDFSINLSFEDLSDSSKIQFLDDLIEKYGVQKRLILEILECEMVEDYELLISALKGFRKKGVRIAIDDFGSGYSNFEHILRLKPEYLKIDSSLIKNILNDHRTYTLVKAIAEFSKELNIKVVAEFVCSQEIFIALRSLDIDEYQGYYFSIPSKELI